MLLTPPFTGYVNLKSIDLSFHSSVSQKSTLLNTDVNGVNSNKHLTRIFIQATNDVFSRKKSLCGFMTIALKLKYSCLPQEKPN